MRASLDLSVYRALTGWKMKLPPLTNWSNGQSDSRGRQGHLVIDHPVSPAQESSCLFQHDGLLSYL